MASTEIRYLDSAQLRLWLPEGASSLRLELADEACYPVAQIRRVFPLSQEMSYLSLQDGAGKEIGVLRSLNELNPEGRAATEHELDRRYFTPKISRIANLKQEGGTWTWEVETSRGNAIFYVRSWRDSSHEMQPGRFLIQSVDGQRFEIASYDKLDDRSKQFIEQLF